MFTFSKPNDEAVGRFLSHQAGLPYSYAEVGCTRKGCGPPAGYEVDRLRVCLGRGRDVFERTRGAISGWKMFSREMGGLYWPDAPIETGSVAGVLFRAGCLWSLNACRVIYAIEESGGQIQYGFAYGTLPGHLERGEERFTVQWQREDDSVWYELLAHSRPRHLLARLGYPWIRYQQARFRKLSGRAMQRACAEGSQQES